MRIPLYQQVRLVDEYGAGDVGLLDDFQCFSIVVRDIARIMRQQRVRTFIQIYFHVALKLLASFLWPYKYPFYAKQKVHIIVHKTPALLSILIYVPMLGEPDKVIPLACLIV